MNPELEQLLSDTPLTVAFNEFDSPDDIDLRRSCVDVLFVNIIGINSDTAGWLPNDDPPDPNERFAWLWFIRPDLASDFVEMIQGDFRLLVEYYRDGRVDDWWPHMSTL